MVAFSFRKQWRLIFCVVMPLILSPLIFLPDDTKVRSNLLIFNFCRNWNPTRFATFQKYKCLYVILLMGASWMVEAIPLSVTALLPVVFFPIFGIQTTGKKIPIGNFGIVRFLKFIFWNLFSCSSSSFELHARNGDDVYRWDFARFGHPALWAA